MRTQNTLGFSPTYLICILAMLLSACAQAGANSTNGAGTGVTPPKGTMTAMAEPGFPGNSNSASETATPVSIQPSATPSAAVPDASATPEGTAKSTGADSTQGAVPTAGAVITPTLPTLEAIPKTPAATATLAQPSTDSGTIQFLGPGPMSKVVDSVKAFGYAVPGDNNKGHLDLYGEDGSLIASELLQLNTPYKWAYFYWELPFTIHSVGELGRLSLSTKDEYGRINAVNSVHLLLLAEGVSLINPPDDLNERVIIDQPVPGQGTHGGVLTVSGKMHPFNTLPLTLQLVTRSGTVIGAQLAALNPIAGSKYASFRVDIPYATRQGTWALLEVQQNDDRIGGIMYLYSREIFLNP
jgi:hypothetical protein